MNGSQIYDLRYYLEQLRYLGLSYDEGNRFARQFIREANGDYDKAGAAMTADLQRRQMEARTA